ncbi:MAG: hypothetical protein OEL86_19400 [Sulfuritalea sp.]|nr:hypothetical protein [Sulfuritalea sp.]
MKTVILNWYGPYNDSSLSNEKEFGYGLYLITGKKKSQRESVIQYCGITERSFRSRFLDANHKKNEVTREREYWLAEVDYPKRISRSTLEITEKLIIYFWQPTLNERKVLSIPDPTTVINRWYKPDGEPRIRQKSIYKDLSDVISWDGAHWRTGNLQVWED